MIDTHCHLTDERLGAQLEAVLQRAADAGVTNMITVSTDLADAQDCIELCRGRGNLRCTVGIHPNNAHLAELAQIPLLAQLQAAPEVVAVGEIGLDYHYGLQHRQRQIEVFESQLEIAAAGKCAVVIHCREALDDCLAIMKNSAPLPAVFHCFTGTASEARRVLDAGYLLGYTGVVTFKKCDEQREAVRLTPLDRLLVETDAPYLAPEPHRKTKINEPAWVVHVADMVGQIKGLNRAEIDDITTKNAAFFFRWAI